MCLLLRFVQGEKKLRKDSSGNMHIDKKSVNGKCYSYPCFPLIVTYYSKQYNIHNTGNGGGMVVVR